MKKPKPNLDVYNAYADHFPYCEVAFWTGLTWDKGKLVPMWEGICVDAQPGAHHLWSLNRRPNLKSNLIKLSFEAHALVHTGTKGEPVSIRMLCHLAKLKKSLKLGDPSEFDLAELATASGRNILGWCECQEFGTETFRKSQRELVEGIRKLETVEAREIA